MPTAILKPVYSKEFATWLDLLWCICCKFAVKCQV